MEKKEERRNKRRSEGKKRDEEKGKREKNSDKTPVFKETQSSLGGSVLRTMKMIQTKCCCSLVLKMRESFKLGRWKKHFRLRK